MMWFWTVFSSGTTTKMAMQCGRNSVGYEVLNLTALLKKNLQSKILILRDFARVIR
jgi:hypothetical protein